MTMRCLGQVHGVSLWVLFVTACCGTLTSCNPARIAHAEAAQGTAAAKKDPQTPPKLPYSQRLTCSTDGDCAIVPSRPCMCQVCGASWHEVLNKSSLRKLQASWAKKRCVSHACPKCESHLLGTKAVCHAGQCAIE